MMATRPVGFGDAHAAPGEKHGPWRYWYESGQIRDEVIYNKGLRQGTYRRWAPDGQASRTFECVAGRRKGPIVKRFAP